MRPLIRLLLPALLILGEFIDAFSTAERSVSRERELAADQAGVEAASATDIASSLVKISAFAPLWDRSADALVTAARAAAPAGQDGTGVGGAGLTDNLSLAYVADIRRSSNRHALDNLAESLPHPTDSHPPLSDRLAAVGVSLESVAAAALLTDPQPAAVELIPDAETLERDLTGTAVALSSAHRPTQAGTGTRP